MRLWLWGTKSWDIKQKVEVNFYHLHISRAWDITAKDRILMQYLTVNLYSRITQQMLLVISSWLIDPTLTYQVLNLTIKLRSDIAIPKKWNIRKEKNLHLWYAYDTL